MNKIKQNRWLQAISIIALLTIMIFGIVGPVQAAVFDNDGIVNADEIIDDDVFLSAENIQMDGTINGALFATGQTIIVTGTVNGDAFLMGNEVIVTETAKIQGNLFAGSSAIIVKGQINGSVASGSAFIQFADGASVGRNVYYGGYSLEAQPETIIQHSLYSGVYQAKLNGQITQDVQLDAGAVEIGGVIDRNVKINLGDSHGNEMPGFSPLSFIPSTSVPMPATLNPGVRISPNAQIKGKLTYTSAVNQTSGIQAQPAGGVVFQTPVPNMNQTAKEQPASGFNAFVKSPVVSWIINTLRNLITLLILGALVLWLIRPWLDRSVEIVGSKTASSAGYGIVVIIVTYAGAFIVGVAIIMLAILFAVLTLGGLGSAVAGIGFSTLALVMVIFGLLVTYISKLVLASLVGDWIMKQLSPNAAGRAYWAMGIGVLLYVVLRSIPILGWLIGFLATILGIGAIWLVFQQWRSGQATGSQPGLQIENTPA